MYTPPFLPTGPPSLSPYHAYKKAPATAPTIPKTTPATPGVTTTPAFAAEEVAAGADPVVVPAAASEVPVGAEVEAGLMVAPEAVEVAAAAADFC
jgi:hypothetical protein